jgi:3-oxoacyl-[acyl-carrier protein] reductase
MDLVQRRLGLGAGPRSPADLAASPRDGGAESEAREHFPYMKEAGGGTIVNVSSGSMLRISRAVDEVNVAYVSSKSAIMGITRAVARELGAHNINVVTVAPGSTTADRDDPLSPDEAFEEQEASLLRRGVPSDLSGVIAFFFNEDARFISGQMIVVNGGREVH